MAKKKVKSKSVFRRWTRAEVKILKKYYCKLTTREVAEKLARTGRAIMTKAHTLDLYKTSQQR